MYVKAVSKNLEPSGVKNFSFEIGKEYFSENGYHFCQSAGQTGEYFENPLKTRYLEVEPLGEFYNIGDGCSFQARKIRIVREILLEELLEDSLFKSRYMAYKEDKDLKEEK